MWSTSVHQHTAGLRQAFSWAVLGALLVASSLLAVPAAAQDVPDPDEPTSYTWTECASGFQPTDDGEACWAPPLMRATYESPTCPSGGQLAPDRTACYYTVVPALTDEVVSCPAGFSASVAGDTCERAPSFLMTINPPRCVGPAGGQNGAPTTDGRGCILPTLPFVEVRERSLVIEAVSAAAPPGEGTPPYLGCPTGYELDDSTCSGEVSISAEAAPIIETETPTTYSCPRGELVGVTCVRELPDDSGLAVYVSAISGPDGEEAPDLPALDLSALDLSALDLSATCNGYPVDFDDPALCVATGTVQVHAPAVAFTPPTLLSCISGFEMNPAQDACVRPRPPTQTVEVPATEIVPEGLLSCPVGFTGPSTNLLCEEDVLWPSPGDGCITGTLREGWTEFVVVDGELTSSEHPAACLLDHAPMLPTPGQAAFCPAGELDALATSCVIDSIGMQCRPEQVATEVGCLISEQAAACAEGELQATGSNGQEGVPQVICVLDTSAHGQGWQVAAEVPFCLGSASYFEETGLCIASTMTIDLPTTCFGYDVTVDIGAGDVPTDGDDVIRGTAGPDVIAAGAGDDIICGYSGDDRIWGQAGDDIVLGEFGDNVLRGGDGNDVVLAGPGSDDLKGGRGDDLVDAGAGDDVAVRGGTGDDVVVGGSGSEELIAGNGGFDWVVGVDGTDKLTGGPRGDIMWGGPGVDLIKGNGGNDRIFADEASDLRGGPGRDVIVGGPDSICNGGITAVTSGDPTVEFDWVSGCASIVNVP